MFKKLIITGAAAGLLLISAGGAFAHHNPAPLPTTNVNNQASDISNHVLTVANTGFNQVNGVSSKHHTSSGLIVTGDASASTLAANVVNTNVGGCGCSTTGNLNVSNNANDVHNTVWTVSNSGVNQVNGGGSIGTGDAGAGSVVGNVVNTNVSL
jgi:hypothetical protein